LASGTNESLRLVRRRPNLRVMKKRALVGLLWFYAAWYAWSIVASFAGLSDLWGPVAGAAVAMLIAGDPAGRIWNRGPRWLSSDHRRGAAVRARPTLATPKRSEAERPSPLTATGHPQGLVVAAGQRMFKLERGEPQASPASRKVDRKVG
jgi:hypothetical protein